MQIETLEPQLATEINNILKNYKYNKTNLVAILLEVQNQIPLHYIPEIVAYYIAEKLNIKITTVYDCITFYASIYDKPRAKYPLQICNSVVCRINDGDGLFEKLQNILNIGLNEVSSDGKYIIEKVACFGACDQAPAVRVNGKIYGHLNSEKDIMAMLKDLT